MAFVADSTRTALTVRAGVAGDVQEVLAFWSYAAEGTDRRDRPEAVLRLIERDPEALLIAELDGRIAGTAYYLAMVLGTAIRAAVGRPTARASLAALLLPSRRLRSLPG